MIKLSTLKITYFVGFIVFGAIIMEIVILYFPNQNDKELNKQFVIHQTNKMQAEFGVECAKLKPLLKVFVETKINPVIAKRVEGGAWIPLLTKELQQDLSRNEEYVRMCSQLYYHGENGQLNGLSNLYHIDNIVTEYSNMSILLLNSIRLSPNCDLSCSNDRFRIIKESNKRLMLILNNQAPSHDSISSEIGPVRKKEVLQNS